MARVLLIRHAQSTFQGIDSPLTEEGRRQADALAAWLIEHTGIDRIVVSQYLRALETILPFAKETGIKIEVDPRLGERVLKDGPFIGEDVWLAAVRASIEDPDLRYEGGETGRETLERGWACLTEALNAPNSLTALVSHGQMSTHLLRAIDPSFGFREWRAMTNPDVFYIARGDSGLRFERVWEQ